MNAVIALCHFCELHGPCSTFTTQTLRDTKLENLRLDQQQILNKLCSACNSLGQGNGIYSTDNESGASFLSAQTSILGPDLVREGAVRSLSVEVNANKDGGFVYFGDTRGHVLSHTFRVCDVQARGFYQLFSIIILMKDKFFLLNIKPFIAENLRRISIEIQTSAQKIKETEEKKGSARQQRLSGTQPISQTTRSLIELTGEKHIYPILHSHFSWLLLAGSRVLTEHVTFGNLPWLNPQSSGGPPQQLLTYNNSTLQMIQKFEETQNDVEQEQFFSLRHIKQIVTIKMLPTVFYCAFSGVKIIVRGAPERTCNFMLCLRKLLPIQMHNLMRIDAQHQHSIGSDYKIISVSNDIAVPIASSAVLRIDFLDKPLDDGKTVLVKWPGQLPNKFPDLMVKLLRAIDDVRFTELVLNKHTKVLVEEWKNKVTCLNRAKTTQAVTKLKRVLGVQPQDQPLVNYWSAHLQ